VTRSLALLALLGGCVSPGHASLDVKTAFAVLTFPEPEKKPAPNDLLQAFASAQLELLTAWDDPHKVAACLTRLGPGLEAAAKTLEETADKLPPGEFPQKAALELVDGCDLALRDRPLLALSFGRFALSTRATARATTARQAEASRVFKAATDATARIAKLLRQTPDEAIGARHTNHPSLALSGGAANGAFTAGYLYELLLDRELALRTLDDKLVGPADQQARFGAVVGTSVGSLETQIVDLYFSEGAAPKLDSPFFNKPPIYGDYPGPQPLQGRELQAFALDTLYRSFVTVDEPALICAENAPVTALVGALAESRPNLMRFDPMSSNIIDPLLKVAAPMMLANGVITTVAAVETMQNQLIGLDERACRALSPAPGKDTFFPKDTQGYCRSSAAMASVVLPFFARPVAHTHSGLTDSGETGAWLDGGLRSTLPVYRALRMSRPRENDSARLRVLALSTLRADGLPTRFPKMVVDVALNAIGQMSSQTITNEVVMAEQFAYRRDQDYADLSALDSQIHVAPAEGRNPVLKSVAPGLERSDAVHTVFVPLDAANGLVADSGYAFDPYVMRGLFTWGRALAVRDLMGRNPEGQLEPKRQLATRLGWKILSDKMAEAAKSHHDELETLLTRYTNEQVESSRPRRVEDGKERILGRLPLCGSLEKEDRNAAPSYFFPGAP
jgi:hypothetical protein